MYIVFQMTVLLFKCRPTLSPNYMNSYDYVIRFCNLEISFILNLHKHEICSGHKLKKANNCWHFRIYYLNE